MPATRDVSPVRKRKAHRKSRRGCANCKLRSIKCDETKPCCKRCESFNVVCCYGSKFGPESLSAKPSFQVHLNTTSQPVVRSPPAPLPISGSKYGSEAYQLILEDIPLIEKFQRRTVWTLGTGVTRHIYAAKTLPLAFTSPLLMHTVLAMAELHDLALSPFKRVQSASLTYHWYHAVSSMRRYLSKPIVPSERDMLWASSNLISISYLANVEARSPEEAWPVRSPSPADLSWFTLCDGQKFVAELTNPMRIDSEFHLPAKELCDIGSWVKGLGTTTELKECSGSWLPREFRAFFGVSPPRSTTLSSMTHDRNTDTSGFNNNRENNIYQGGYDEMENGINNPYYASAKSAAELFQLDLDQENFLMHICFARALDPPIRDLLIQKDEKAMLLLLYWYAKICDQRVWWLWKHSYTEGIAICRYLERVWTASEYEDGLALLELPKMRLMAAF
ncbi:hypothetical protein F5Y03DRAFT_374424 [Xylaria venustula]|nr:hypothetical protein F5Y03DRAFT_374424 [Xylaria venustula]